MAKERLPFAYDTLNATDGPCMLSFVNIHNSNIALYFKRYLLQEALSVFDFALPPEWDADYFRLALLGMGFVAVFDSGEFGIIPQHCTLSGRNVFYRPARCIVANPLLPTVHDMRIGEQCTLIKLMPDYGNICDIVDNYGNMLALAYQTAAVNILNSKVSYVLPVADKADADTLKAALDEVNSGYPAVYVRKRDGVSTDDFLKPFTQNVGQNFIAPEVLETMRTIRDMFLTDIGIPNMSTRKKERVNLDESGKNSVETECKARLWLAELETGFEAARAMFPDYLTPDNFAVKLRFEEDDGIVG